MIPGVQHEYIFVVASLAVTTFIVILSIAGRLALGSGESAIQPAGTLSVKGFFEAFVEAILGLVKMVLGDHSEEWVPLFGAIFFYILVSNLSGLLPGLLAGTQDINTALAIGLYTFVIYNYFGLKHHGLGYLKHFLGPLIWIAPLILPLELISHIVRPMSLGLRLSGNLSGDHAVLSIFLGLVPFGIPIIFYALGLFVCLVQSLVFTLLSMIYVMMATASEH